MISTHLSLSVVNHGTCCKIVVAPYVKPTSCKIPLATDSAHAANVHVSWPKAELERLKQLSPSKPVLQRTIRELMEAFHAEPRLFQDFIMEPKPNKPFARSKRTCWLVCAFSPILQHAISREVAKFNADNHWLLDLAYGRNAPEVKLSWSSSGTPLIQQLVKSTVPRMESRGR